MMARTSAPCDCELAVAFEVGLGEFAEDGAGGFLRAAFPGGAGAGLFGGAGLLEAFEVEVDAGIAAGVYNEVERKSVGFVEARMPLLRQELDESRGSDRAVDRLP